MEEHNEIYTIIHDILKRHPIELTILIFVVSTVAGIIRFSEKKTPYILYHVMSSLTFFLTWMVFCAHIMLESFYALLGVSVGGYMGPKATNIIVFHVLEKIKSKFKH